jgi:AraC-like DNA-binding protein
MLRAMELLAEQRTPVIEIAYAVGFQSISAFNSAFRTFTQETPTQYRKQFAPQ